MNEKILENKISELLGVSESEKNLAFSIFKEKLSGYLKVGQALRISDLGVFQLKEKLDHSDESKIGSKASNLTLVFSPESDDPSSDSLFVNLEVDTQPSDDLEFNDKVFQLGIGKPLITKVMDDDPGEQIQSVTEKIEDNVSSILDKSEKLDGFDLWDDYLKRKETTNILDEPEDTDLAIDSIIDESNEEIQKVDFDELEDDFSPQEEEEILEDYLQETNLLNEEELDSISDELNVEDIQIPDSIEESMEIATDDDIDEETNTEISNPELESEPNNVEPEVESKDNIEIATDDDIDEETNIEISIPELESEQNNLVSEVESKDESVIEKIEEEIEELETFDKLSIEEPIYEDELSDIPEEVESSALEETFAEPEELVDEVVDEIIENEVVKDIKNDDEKLEIVESDLNIDEEKPNKSKRKSIILLLFASIIIIGAIGIYYMFFNDSAIVKSGEVKEVALVEDENVDEPILDPIDNSVIKEETDIVTEIKDEATKNNIENDPPSSEEVYENTDTEEREVSDNIYYDGFVYNVQVSSWKKASIAENEVNKLVKKGFPAYKVEVYIPKFKGTWYRVRIGPFPSLVEAQETKQKVNK